MLFLIKLIFSKELMITHKKTNKKINNKLIMYKKHKDNIKDKKLKNLFLKEIL